MLFLIKTVRALLPVVLFLGVPAYFILRFLFRRLRRSVAAPPAPHDAPPPHAPPPV